MPADVCYRAPRLGNPAMAWDAFVSTSLQFATFAACGIQLLIDPTQNNIFSSLLILASSTLTLQYLRATSAFKRFPLSSLALLGLCITTQWGALVLQSACWTSVSKNLRDPVRTFELLVLYQSVAVLAHLVFSHLGATISLRRVIADRVLAPMGVFEIPSANALWAMGALGTAATYFTHSGFEHGLRDKVLAGVSYFFVAPFLIPLLHARYGPTYCDLRRHGAALVAYALAVLAVAIATNGRGFVFGGMMAAGVVYLLFALRDPRPIQARSLWKIVVLAVVAIPILGYSGDLATAMLIGRLYRDRNHSQWDVIEETVDALRQPDRIQAYRDKVEAVFSNSLYDEKYFDNDVFGRIVETKYHDNMFVFSEGLRPEDELLAYHATVDRLWSLLPTPLLKLFKIPVDKSNLQYSMGDFWIDLRYGKGVGGYATGSMLADIRALFGPWFSLVYFCLCIFLFVAWEAMSRPNPRGAAQISVVALLMSLQLFQYGITAQELVAVLVPLRGLPQNVVLYLLVYWVTRLAFHPFVPTKTAGAAADEMQMAVARERVTHFDPRSPIA